MSDERGRVVAYRKTPKGQAAYDIAERLKPGEWTWEDIEFIGKTLERFRTGRLR